VRSRAFRCRASSPIARSAIPPAASCSSSRATRPAAQRRLVAIVASRRSCRCSGIGEGFDVTKIRYHRIIQMSDADVDGAHIRTLLLTFFYRHMPEVIEAGYLYIAQPPLYRVSTGKVTKYAQSEQERDRFVKELNVKNITVQRFKGLGEMNADQLWETTMNPETRTLLRVDSENAALADEIFTMLMGEKVGPRKDFIKTEARKVQNLDV
jgi:DNA gyrase subunit B